MRILVTGGTGFVGRRLVKELSKTDKVIVFSRGKGISQNVDFIEGDVRNEEELYRAFKDVDIVYHLAAVLDETSPELWNINVNGTKNVAEVCKKNGVKQLILLSSSGVLGETSTPATEGMTYNPQTKYEESKMECEKLVIGSGVPYTIIRSSIILGPNNVWLKIVQAAKKGYPIIGSGKNLFHLAYIDDVINLLIKVKNNKKALNQIFHIASPDVPTYEEVYKGICEELEVPMTKKHVPVFVAKFISLFYSIRARLFGGGVPLTMRKSSINRLVRNRALSIEKVRRILGFEPECTTKQGIEKTVKALKEMKLI